MIRDRFDELQLAIVVDYGFPSIGAELTNTIQLAIVVDYFVHFIIL